MFSKFELDTVIAVAGFLQVLAGVYLLLGLEAALILSGLVTVYVGVVMNPAPAVVERPQPTTHPASEHDLRVL